MAYMMVIMREDGRTRQVTKTDILQIPAFHK